MSDTWVQNTAAFDRVKGVALTVSEPRTAGWIASEAQVSENTARNHLTRLADLGVLTTTTTEQGTGYAPDPIYTRSQDIRELVDERTVEELAATATEVQEELQRYRDTYDADSPEALRASVADTDRSPDAARERLEAASDWEYARYRLSLLRDALDHYDTYTTPRSASA
jgi:predicted ArsR family transcriptional regulator